MGDTTRLRSRVSWHGGGKPGKSTPGGAGMEVHEEHASS